MEFEEQMPVSVYPYLFDSVLRNTFSSYSIWSTSGSELVEPCLFLTQGMPQISGLPAMMDGQWQHWGWQQTCQIQELETEEQV
jgi:type VI secretion system protein ImpM